MPFKDSLNYLMQQTFIIFVKKKKFVNVSSLVFMNEKRKKKRKVYDAYSA